jgi:hypothetical protein
MSALTRREDLVRDQLAHPPRQGVRAADAVRLGISGSGDDLLVLAWSAAELARERAAGTRLLARAGITAGMRIANTLPGALVTPGSLLLGDVVEELGGLDVPLGAIATEADAIGAWELVDRVEPAVLILDPRSAPRFLTAAPERIRPWWRGILWLRSTSATPTIPAAAGFQGWQRDWLAVPEVTSFAAGSCTAGRLHLDRDLAADIVDARLVLGPRRFLTGLAARLLSGSCTCGDRGPVLEILP